MSTGNGNTAHRLWGWLGLVPLVVGASIAFLRFGTLAGIVSGNIGRRSAALLVKEADAKAEFWGWVLLGLVAGAIIVATVLIPPIKSEDFSPGFKGTLRFLLAILLVVGSMTLIVYGLADAAYYWR